MQAKIKMLLKSAGVAFFALLVGACAHFETMVGDSPEQDANALDEKKQEAQAHYPKLELSEDLLANLVEANISSYYRQWPSSAKAFLKAAEQSRDPRLASYATALSMELGDPELALASSELWAELSQGIGEEREKVLPSLIWSQLAAGKVLEAKASIEELLEPELLANFEQALRWIVGQPNKEAALELMQSFLLQYPQDATLKLYGASVANSAKQKDLANRWVDEVLQAEPDNEMATQFKLQSLVGDEAYEQRKALLIDYLDRNPKSVPMILALAREFSRQKEFELALEWSNKALKLDKKNVPALSLSAALADQMEMPDQAVEYFTRLLVEDAGNDAARWALARLAIDKEDYQTALGYYRDVNDQQYWFSAQLQIARMTYRLDGLKDAVRFLDGVAPRSTAEYIDHALARHYLLLDEQQYQEALGYINEALVVLPESIELLFARGLVSAEELDVEAAEADFRKILELEPDNANALNALGYTLADLTDRFEEARDLIEQALKLNPDAPHILDSMGWVLYRQNQLEQALSYLLRAYEIDQDAEIAAHLGEIYWELDKRDKAMETWQSGFEKEATNPALVRTLERFNVSFE
jgi:tetratricopeptide (TPR) repeat protein